MYLSANQHTSIPHYAKSLDDDLHFKELRKEVIRVLDQLPSSRIAVAQLKAIILPVLYFGFYLAALSQTNYLLFLLAYSVMGLLLVIMFLNLIHETCHNTLFRSKIKNEWYLLLFDIMGANSYMWKKRHIRLHHIFTNVNGWDSDIEKSKFLKVHPQNDKKIASKYQHLMVLLYPLFITNWFLVRDFKDYFDRSMIVRKIVEIPGKEYFKLFFFKLFFIGYLVIIPGFISSFSWMQIVIALFIMLLSAGFFALIVLLPPHVNTSNQFPVTDNKMKLEQSWLMHQLNTTNDVDTSNWFTRHIMANSNYHIAHHLFPNISYVYAAEISDAIKKYNQKAGLPYRSYPLISTFKSHYKLIKTNGRTIDIMDEDL